MNVDLILPSTDLVFNDNVGSDTTLLTASATIEDNSENGFMITAAAADHHKHSSPKPEEFPSNKSPHQTDVFDEELKASKHKLNSLITEMPSCLMMMELTT